MADVRALVIILCAALASGLLATPRPVAAQAESTPRGYEDWVRDALESQKRGDFERAHASFAEAHALRPNARTLRGMGVASFQAGHDLRALKELEAALAHPEKPLDAELRAAVEDLMARAHARLGVVTVNVTPLEAIVQVDDRPELARANTPLTLEPGPHTLHLRAEGYTEQSFGIDVAQGSKQSVRVALVKESEASPEPLPPVVSQEGPEQPQRLREAVRRPPERRAHRLRMIGAYTGLSLGAAAGLATLAVYLSGTYVRMPEVVKYCERLPAEGCTQEQFDQQVEDANLEGFHRASLATGIIAATGAAVGLSMLTWDFFAEGKKISLRLSGQTLELSGRF